MTRPTVRSSAISAILFLIAAALVLTVAETAVAKPAKPKPWMWTTATAAHQAAALDIWPDVGTLTAVRCQGKGKPFAKRYGAFRCTATFMARTVAGAGQPVSFWVKVRRQSTGQPCASPAGLSSIPSGCLNPKGARAVGSRDDAEVETQKTVGGPGGLYQGQVGCVGSGAGFWRCWFGSEEDTPTSGHSIVVFRPSAVQVTILNLPAA